MPSSKQNALLMGKARQTSIQHISWKSYPYPFQIPLSAQSAEFAERCASFRSGLITSYMTRARATQGIMRQLSLGAQLRPMMMTTTLLENMNFAAPVEVSVIR